MLPERGATYCCCGGCCCAGDGAPNAEGAGVPKRPPEGAGAVVDPKSPPDGAGAGVVPKRPPDGAGVEPKRPPDGAGAFVGAGAVEKIIKMGN